MKCVTIHHAPAIAWQAKRVDAMRTGLERLGYGVQVTTSRERLDEHPAVLFGTTFFRAIEAVEGDWLLVDRCSFGDTTQHVSLVWNGHGRRGDHCVPADYNESRWRQHGVRNLDGHFMRNESDVVVLCGQESTYSPDWKTPAEWYSARCMDATHFRPHPAAGFRSTLPEYHGLDVSRAITLNSSVALEFLLAGVPVEVDDAGGMAFGWEQWPNLRQFFEWLAYTQWSWDEIADGDPISHLFDSR